MPFGCSRCTLLRGHKGEGVNGTAMKKSVSGATQVRAVFFTQSRSLIPWSTGYVNRPASGRQPTVQFRLLLSRNKRKGTAWSEDRNRLGMQVKQGTLQFKGSRNSRKFLLIRAKSKAYSYLIAVDFRKKCFYPSYALRGLVTNRKGPGRIIPTWVMPA